MEQEGAIVRAVFGNEVSRLLRNDRRNLRQQTRIQKNLPVCARGKRVARRIGQDIRTGDVEAAVVAVTEIVVLVGGKLTRLYRKLPIRSELKNTVSVRRNDVGKPQHQRAVTAKLQRVVRIARKRVGSDSRKALIDIVLEQRLSLHRRVNRDERGLQRIPVSRWPMAVVFVDQRIDFRHSVKILTFARSLNSLPRG